MSMTIVDRLEEAAEAGEVLECIYHGGSQKGAVRELAPIRVNGNKFHAKCMATGNFKTYMVEKLEIVGEEHLSLPEDWKPDHVRQYEKQKSRDAQANLEEEPVYLNQYLYEIVTSLQECDWHVVSAFQSIPISDQSIPIGIVSVYPIFKNGKPKKTPILQFSVQPIEDENKHWPNDNSQQLFLKARPFSITGECRSKSYADLDKAVDYFYDQANLLAVEYGLQPICAIE